jgi:ribose-phosphate pyrophosphokinase
MDPILFSGRSLPALGHKLAAALGVEPGRCLIKDFADGEFRIEVKQEVAGREVLVLQSTAAPAGQNLLELLLLADAARRRGAGSVTAVIPYFGYARQDCRVSGEEPIGARLVTDLLASRCDRILAVDLHNPAIEGFAGIPFCHLSAVPLLAEAFRPYRQPEQVLVAPDAGALKLARRYGQLLQLPVACIEKVRKSDREVEARVVTGEVRDRAPVLVDDMIATGGTLIAAGQALLEAGARNEISVIASHCLLVGEASAALEQFNIKRLLTTDSLPSPHYSALPIERQSLAPLLAESLRQWLGS